MNERTSPKERDRQSADPGRHQNRTSDSLPDADPSARPPEAAAIQQLRESQLRLTPQRQAIYEYLLRHPTHPKAEEIYQAVRQQFPAVSLGTVYNTLNLLVDKGLVQPITSVDRSARFDLVRGDHYHLVCERCGRIVDYPSPAMDQALAAVEADAGWQLARRRLELVGLCPECRWATAP